jgi:hypothetical protein
MAARPLYLRKHFPEGVELLCQSPPLHWMTIDVEKDLPGEYKVRSCWHRCQLTRKGASPPDIRRLCEQAAQYRSPRLEGRRTS